MTKKQNVSNVCFLECIKFTLDLEIKINFDKHENLV